MGKYLVLYRSSSSAAQQMANATPEQMKAGMEAWMAWSERAGNSLVDLGAPLADGTRIPDGDGSPATDSGISGFSVLQADSTDQVKALLREHPHLGMPGGSSIEVLEFLPMPGT